MYLSLADKGSVSAILKNWPQRRVKAICLTDGERCGTLGDLGVQASACARGARRRVAGCTHAWVWCGGCGCARAPATKRRPPPPPTLPPSLSRLAPQAIGMPISRLALYTAVGGVVPSACMPVTIDCGTDNDALLQARSHAGAVCVIVCMPARCSCLPAPLPARPPALPPTCLPGGPPAALHGPALCRTLCPAHPPHHPPTTTPSRSRRIRSTAACATAASRAMPTTSWLTSSSPPCAAALARPVGVREDVGWMSEQGGWVGRGRAGGQAGWVGAESESTTRAPCSVLQC